MKLSNKYNRLHVLEELSQFKPYGQYSTFRCAQLPRVSMAVGCMHQKAKSGSEQPCGFDSLGL